MPGSRDSIAEPNVVLNTITAEAFADACDYLEKADDFDQAVEELTRKNFTEHRKIIFEGNGYSEDWVREAERRGLPNITCMADAIGELTTEKTRNMYKRFGVFSDTELESRAEVKYELYSKTINIEAKAMINIVNKQIIPAVIGMTTKLADSVNAVRAAGVDEVSVQTALLQETSALLVKVRNDNQRLAEVDVKAQAMEPGMEQAKFYHDQVCKVMEELRASVDRLENISDKDSWPMPSYGDLLFEV